MNNINSLIIIHPQEKNNYLLFNGIIRWYCSNNNHITLLCRDDMLNLVEFMYSDLSNITIFSIDSEKVDKNDLLYIFNLLNKNFKKIPLISFGIYDRLRKDNYTNHNIKLKDVNMYDMISNYDLDPLLIDNFSFIRDLKKEFELYNKFKNFLGFSFIINNSRELLSKVKYDNIALTFDITTIMKKNKNYFIYIKIIELSNAIVLINNEFAGVLYFLQKYKYTKFNKNVFLYHNEKEDISFYTNPKLKNWNFKDINTIK